MRKKKIIIPVAILVAVLLIGTSIYRAKGQNEAVVSVTTLKEQELRTTVMIPGTLALANEQSIYYDMEKGDVDTIHVKEGDTVKIGTPLVTYKNETLSLEEQQSDLTRQSSNLQIESINKQLNQLSDKQDELEKEIGKQAAKEQVAAERNQLNLELDTAKIERKRSDLERETVRKKKAGLSVESEINGTVLNVNKEADVNTADIQEPLVHIGNTTSFTGEGVLSEYDALNVKKGQPVTITSDVIPDKEWTGRVTKVDLLPQKQADPAGDTANQYPVEITIADSSISDIKPGFKLLMEIETSKKTAYAVPAEAVRQDEKEEYVFVAENGKAVKKTVKTGQKTNKLIEITSGIKGKDKVIINPPEDLIDGMDVKVK
ncbi:efflux RND transporter periplasmic adaptor subunit [Domibacillus epiphyticus]|uniref:Efflux transporter periplasmic adaptor subunit n=1 Tax=Domibacillus epiphyticus TaxID=1714355 RepID=A0A1V2A6C4_9BACI|nr:efflux RND transporter periplasmic adaptor subunit [Domibacillus epiphyticus]OMP66538.1 efflux transporter periplasmic adaptor subunit [Domibacillus epiphyticus]